MLKLNILTKKTHHCVVPRILSHNASKSVKGFDLCACLGKKKIKKSQESDISPISPICWEVTRKRIFTKLGTNVPLINLINCDKFCDNLFKGFNFTGGQIPNFPIGIWRRRYNSAAPRSLWFAVVYHFSCVDVGFHFRVHLQIRFSKYAAVRHLGFSYIRSFYSKTDISTSFNVNMQNFAAIGRAAAELMPIVDFQNCGHPSSCIII